MQLEPDIERVLWNKLIIAVGCNAASALLRLPLGSFASLRGTSLGLMADGAMAECAAVMSRLGVTVEGDPVKRLEEIAASAPGNFPSMLQDLLSERPTEIDSINGAVARYGENVRGYNTHQ